jgi:phosphoribosylformylglycinamidine cyclo-ligase
VVNNIRNGQVIVAFASYGKSVYEDAYNGGTGSNGLTSARHDVFSKVYADKYPESYDHHIAQDLVYAGSQLLTDPSPVEGVDVGKLVLSPTRTYLPLIKLALDKYRDNIHGMIHCSGGAQTKVMKFVENVKIVKDQLLDVPPLFSLIQEESKTSWKEMFQVFNMGHRLEMYVDENAAQGLIDISKQLGIDAQVIGHVEKFDGELLELVHEGNKYIYDQF